MKKTKIAICGGHLTCALATISALRQKRPRAEIIFFGRKHPMEGDSSLSAEYQIIPKLDITFLPLTAGRLQRRLTKYTIISLVKIPLGFLQSFYYLLREKPDIIFSFGGYLSFPVIVAGWILGIPSITHEQSVIPGLATRLNAFFVKKIAISWPRTGRDLKNKKMTLTGNPIRREIFETQASDLKLKKFLENIKLTKNRPLIYITGGNQGSHFINETIGKILHELLKNYFLIHQTGDSKVYNDYENLELIYRKNVTNGRYFLTKYLGPKDIGAVFNACDIVISRAGANIVTELLALGKPAILIPLPWSGGGEQEENAKLAEKTGMIQILFQEKLTPYILTQSIDKTIQNLGNLKNKAPLAKRLVKIDAAQRLVEEALSLVESERSK